MELCCGRTQVPATVKGINERWGKREDDAHNTQADKWIDRDGWMEPGVDLIQKLTVDKKNLW